MSIKHVAHLRQHCHNSKSAIFQEKILKVLKCYNFLWVQRRHNCSPAASYANCIMTLYLLKVHLQTFLSIPITKKCQIFSYDTLVANELYMVITRQATKKKINTQLCLGFRYPCFTYVLCKICPYQVAWPWERGYKQVIKTLRTEINRFGSESYA